jgi:hypothetical protein
MYMCRRCAGGRAGYVCGHAGGFAEDDGAWRGGVCMHEAAMEKGVGAVNTAQLNPLSSIKMCKDPI